MAQRDVFLPSYIFVNAEHIAIRLYYVERTTGFPHLHTADDILELGSCETDAIAILYNKVSNLNVLYATGTCLPKRVFQMEFMSHCVLLQLNKRRAEIV